MNISNSFLDYFKDIKDPRADNHNRRHELFDIFVITILGTICGADGWNELYDFALAKQEWLKTFLALPHGVPSHDTFRRVFLLLDPKEFETAFLNWIASLAIDTKNQIIAIDGKSLRGSIDRKNKKLPLHLVSAWVKENKCLLAQVKTAEKSNEIEAVPRLLKMLDIKEAVVTVDAMGCQKEIAQQIVQQEADFILSLKANQPTLYQDVKSIFAKATEGEKNIKRGCTFARSKKTKAMAA